MTQLIELDKAADDGPVMVVFHTWQQECSTNVASLKEALDWIGECYLKGFLYPDEIVGRDGVVLMDKDALHDFTVEL